MYMRATDVEGKADANERGRDCLFFFGNRTISKLKCYVRQYDKRLKITYNRNCLFYI